MWAIFAIFSAFFQAISMAYGKHLLNKILGIRNTIATISFLTASVIVGCMYFFTSGSLLWHGELSFTFWHALFWAVAFNIIAVWFLYKALEIADLNYLMPYMVSRRNVHHDSGSNYCYAIRLRNV